MANKAEVIKKVAGDLGVTENGQGLNGTVVVNTVIDAIQDLLVQDEEVRLTGFGTFKVKERAARVGRNPQTQEEMEIPAKKVASFKVAQGLKDLVAGE